MKVGETREFKKVNLLKVGNFRPVVTGISICAKFGAKHEPWSAAAAISRTIRTIISSLSEGACLVKCIVTRVTIDVLQ